jgi:hypothetical protein
VLLCMPATGRRLSYHRAATDLRPCRCNAVMLVAPGLLRLNRSTDREAFSSPGRCGVYLRPIFCRDGLC